MEIEVQEALIGSDVLLGQIAQKRTLAASGLPEHRDVHRAPGITERPMPSRHLAIRHLTSEIEASTFRPCSAFLPAKAVPE